MYACVGCSYTKRAKVPTYDRDRQHRQSVKGRDKTVTDQCPFQLRICPTEFTAVFDSPCSVSHYLWLVNPPSIEQDVLETRDEAQGLMSRSLLQAVDGEGYRIHDLLLDFARDRVKPALLELSTKCQARYLSRLDVVRGYADESSTTTGFYTLMVLWRSAEELSDNPLLQVEAYRASLHVLAAEESSDAVYIHWTLGNLFALQVGACTRPIVVWDKKGNLILGNSSCAVCTKT